MTDGSIGTVTPEQREGSLAQAVANYAAQGWRVESRGRFDATLVKGKRISHGLHGALTFLTLGAWAFVWVPMAIMYKERRMVLNVDDYGRALVSEV
jgi:hypothetical protein